LRDQLVQLKTQKIPLVIARKLPVRSEKFPVPMLREFDRSHLI
jgi:hypothetical protein